MRYGSPIGSFRRATITKYNGDGTVQFVLDQLGISSVSSKYTASIPASWLGPSGEFSGGYPEVGSTIVVCEGFGSEWFIVSYLPSEGIFNTSPSISSSNLTDNQLVSLKPGRILNQVKDGTKIYIDPVIGIVAGKSNYIQINPNDNILSHNFYSRYEFTESSRKIEGVIKRDLFENNTRSVLSNTLDSQSYDQSLFTIGMDSSASVNSLTSGNNLRNPALTESREVYYEFGNSYKYLNDKVELDRYIDPNAKIKSNSSRKDLRVDTLSLNLSFPNHLIETVKGTVVDVFGNILDLNRNILSIGKKEDLSLRKGKDKSKTFLNIRNELRKSIAYHFEINTRKDLIDSPDVNNTDNYSRNRSRFFFDVDKEGQFKINVPSSSETGNIPLLTRYENYSNVLAKEDNSVDPNSFIKPDNNQDIFLDNFAGKSSIKLVDENDGYVGPIDRIKDSVITLGTAFHNILDVCRVFQKSADYLTAGKKLVDFDTDNRLNTLDTPLDKIVSDKIIVSGPNANGGGRSGTISLDGMLIWNIGANSLDRQSVWLDCAGSYIAAIGRDKNNISVAANLDGDLLVEVGGSGIGNSYDSRFNDQNDAYKNGKAEIRVHNNGQTMILRMAPEGISIISCGTITFSAQQDIILRSNSNILMEAEQVVMYGETTKRIVNRFPATNIG